MQTKQRNITTGTRILATLNLLQHGEYSTSQLIGLLDKFGKLSPDIVRCDILTLQNAGYEIQKRGHKYFSNWKPEKVFIDKKEFNTLNAIKNAVIEICDWKYIVNLYVIFGKIAKNLKNEKYAETLMNFGYFSNIDIGLLHELDFHTRMQNEVIVRYLSPKNNEIQDYKIRCKQIRYDKNTGKLHLYGQFEEYDYTAYLRIDKILSVKNRIINTELEYAPIKCRKYKIKKEAIKDFLLEDNETIEKITANAVLINAKVENNFQFMQRLIVLGDKVVKVDKTMQKMILDNLTKTYEEAL